MSAVAYQSHQQSTTMPQPKWRFIDWSRGFNPGWRGDAMDAFVSMKGEEQLSKLMISAPRPVANVKPKPAQAGAPKSGRRKFGKGGLAIAIAAVATEWRSTRELADEFGATIGSISCTLERMLLDGKLVSRLETYRGHKSRLWRVKGAQSSGPKAKGAGLEFLDARRNQILAAVADWASAKEVQAKTGFARSSVQAELPRMTFEGLLESKQARNPETNRPITMYRRAKS